MAPLIALLGGTLLTRVLGLLAHHGFGVLAGLDHWSVAVRVGLAVMFALTASAHFGGPRRAGLVAMVPPALPRPELLVLVTGGLELAGAIGLLIPATARAAAICLAVLLLVMFPANVSAARRGLRLAGRPVTPLLPRTGLQLFFLAACVAAALQ